MKKSTSQSETMTGIGKDCISASFLALRLYRSTKTTYLTSAAFSQSHIRHCWDSLVSGNDLHQCFQALNSLFAA